MLRWIETEEYKGISCGVSLSLYINNITCQVHSLDQTWYLGKKSQIESFFSSKKPWYSFSTKLVIVLPAIIMLLLVYSAELYAEKQFNEIVLPVVCTVIFIISYVLISNQKLFPFVKIQLQEVSKRKFGFSEWCVLIGGIAGLGTNGTYLSFLG